MTRARGVWLAVLLAGLTARSARADGGFAFDDGTNQGWRSIGLYDDGGLTKIPGWDWDDPAGWIDHYNSPDAPPNWDAYDNDGVIILGSGGHTFPASPGGSSWLHWDLVSPDLSGDLRWQEMAGLDYDVCGQAIWASGDIYVQAVLRLEDATGGETYYAEQFHLIDSTSGGAGTPWTTVTAHLPDRPTGLTLRDVSLRVFFEPSTGIDGYVLVDDVEPHAELTAWDSPLDGGFHSARNWDAGVPEADDTAAFALGSGGYTVSLARDALLDRMFVRNDTMTLDAGSETCTLTSDRQGWESLVVGGSSPTQMTVTGGRSGKLIAEEVCVGRDEGTSGTLAVPGVIQCQTVHLGGRSSGEGGDGQLTVHRAVSAEQVVRLWPNGSADVDGGLLSADRVEWAGGSLNVGAGGVLATNALVDFPEEIIHPGSLRLGVPGASDCELIVGTGRRLEFDEGIAVGHTAPATLWLTSGGSVSTARLTVGGDEGLVDLGPESSLVITEELKILGSGVFHAARDWTCTADLGVSGELDANGRDVTFGGALLQSALATVSAGRVACDNLTVGNYVNVGGLITGGAGHVVQKGGAVCVEDLLAVGAQDAPGLGLYEIRGGSLSVGRLTLSPHLAGGGLHIGGPAPSVTVRQCMRIGNGGSFTTDPGSRIALIGASVEIEEVVPIPGLADVNLAFRDGSGDLEAVWPDVGLDPGAWDPNLFVLDALTVDGNAHTAVAIVDLYDNVPAHVGPEAVYVETLAMGRLAVLDGSGGPVYYRNGGDPKRFYPADAQLDGQVDVTDLAILAAHWQEVGDDVCWGYADFNGDGEVDVTDLAILAANWREGTKGPHVPEPATAWLVLVGAGALGARRRGRGRLEVGPRGCR